MFLRTFQNVPMFLNFRKSVLSEQKIGRTSVLCLTSHLIQNIFLSKLEEDEEEDDLEPGCCNSCWDKEVAWFEVRPRVASATACKFQAFAFVFCTLGASMFALQQVS